MGFDRGDRLLQASQALSGFGALLFLLTQGLQLLLELMLLLAALRKASLKPGQECDAFREPASQLLQRLDLAQLMLHVLQSLQLLFLLTAQAAPLLHQLIIALNLLAQLLTSALQLALPVRQG